MKKKLEVAFMGGGVDSAVGMAHYAAINIDGLFNLVAGCFSLNQLKNLESAEYCGVDSERVYTTLDDLLDNEQNKLDAIIILTPTPSHYEDVMLCLSKGIPVICEKALSTSSNEVKKLMKYVAEYRGFLSVTYNYSGYPLLKELQTMIASGRLGKVEQIQIEMPQETFMRVDSKGSPIAPQEWRLKDEALPTVSLDLGVHLHQLIFFLTNEKPIEVIAVQNSFGHFEGVVDDVNCIANYTNDLVANIWFSKSALGHRNGLNVRVYGDKGSAKWYQMEPEKLTLTNPQGDVLIKDRASGDMKVSNQQRYTRFKAGHPAGYIEAFANHYYDIYESLQKYRNNRSSTCGLGADEAYEGLLMLEAISLSAKLKKWIEL
jgi:predicted dehydrogenase